MKHVIKVANQGGQIRLTIPRRIIEAKRWGDLAFVLVEDHHDDKLVISRLIEKGALKDGDTKS